MLMTIDQLVLKKTELKHNINQRLGIVFEPFSWMRKDGAMDHAFFSMFGEKIVKLEAGRRLVCCELDEKWYAQNDTPEQQLKCFISKATHFNEMAIPVIMEAKSFFMKEVNDHSSFFNQSNPFGFRALHAVTFALQVVDPLIKDIQTLLNCEPPKNSGLTKVNLLLEVERVLDRILNADVRYVNAFEFSEKDVTVMKDEFDNCVLNNIKENIVNHAFSTQDTEQRIVSDNLVKVSFEETEKSIIVSIANNGAPFEGDVNRLFTPEYYYGPKGHSGYGLHSAREAMREMGGDLSIHTSAGPFVFTYYLLINK